MVQIIKEHASKPVVFLKALQRGMFGGHEGDIRKNLSEYADMQQAKQAQQQQKQQLAQENKYLTERSGGDFDFSKIETPQLRAAALAQQLKSEGKEKEFQQFQNMFPEFFGDQIRGETTQPVEEAVKQSDIEKLKSLILAQGQQQPEQPTQQRQQPTTPGVQTQPTTQPQPKKQLPYDPKKIAATSLINPAAAREMRAANDAAAREIEAAEKLAQKEKLSTKKEVTESFKENKDFIDKTYDQYEDSLRKEAIIDKMNTLEEDTSGSGIINLLRSVGMEDEWLQNPTNEEYTKLGLDLLGGGTLQADYGSRVLQSEFMVSQKRIPELMQTKEGRRQIAENYKTMLLPARLKKERLQFYLDRQERTGDPLPHNLRGKILQDIKPQLEEAYDKFKQRNGRYKVREGTEVDENAIIKYYHLTNGNEEKARKWMKEDGYDLTK